MDVENESSIKISPTYYKILCIWRLNYIYASDSNIIYIIFLLFFTSMIQWDKIWMHVM